MPAIFHFQSSASRIYAKTNLSIFISFYLVYFYSQKFYFRKGKKEGAEEIKKIIFIYVFLISDLEKNTKEIFLLENSYFFTIKKFFCTINVFCVCLYVKSSTE